MARSQPQYDSQIIVNIPKFEPHDSYKKYSFKKKACIWISRNAVFSSIDWGHNTVCLMAAWFGCLGNVSKKKLLEN